jgi:hypothetical protein
MVTVLRTAKVNCQWFVGMPLRQAPFASPAESVPERVCPTLMALPGGNPFVRDSVYAPPPVATLSLLPKQAED